MPTVKHKQSALANAAPPIGAPSPPRLIGREVVCDRLGIGRTQVHMMRRAGTLPEPIMLGKRILWPDHEINSVVKAIIAGSSRDELRALVQELMSARKC
jgi:predicted DNA-binding transcriptional regulator AlpA